jgi:hypothetical protein
MDIYSLSRNFWNYAFDNPEKITPTHTAIYFFAIEHCNRLWWKEKFWFPSQMTMEAIWVNKHQTYIKYFNDLVDWWFIKLIEKSKNQYSSNIISLIFAIPKKDKALDKALIKHTAKQGSKHRAKQGTYNNNNVQEEQYNNIQDNISKDTETKVSETTDIIIEEKTYWNKEINDTLVFLCKSVWIDTFKETQQMQRNFWKHIVNYINKVWKEDFIKRLKGVLQDDFKSKNCNSIKYLYSEIKAYIYNPVIEPERKNRAIYI